MDNKDILFGNRLIDHETVAYIIGDEFVSLSQLPGILTITQFFMALLEDRLPVHRVWVVGQGIDPSERKILRLCEAYRPNIRLHVAEEMPTPKGLDATEALEWQSFQFVDSTRVQAELKLAHLSEDALLAHDFLFIAARELSEKSCQHVVPNGRLLIKQAQLQSFHRCFPLPLTVETQFQLANDNKRSLKSLSRFYQDYSCIAEVSLSFDLYTLEDAQQLLKALGAKTFGHFSEKIKEEC